MSPNIIDIEASGFGYESYPIEIGVILNTGEKYCSLIKPVSNWVFWSLDAENTHHISKELLQDSGKTVTQVANELNQFLQNKTVYSDGWVVDKPWLNELFAAAKIPIDFSISPLEFILDEYQMENWHETKNSVVKEFSLVRHRASSDAMIIQETYRRTRIKQ